MRRWLFRCLELLYPKAWRERYGDEVGDLSEELLAAGEVKRPRLVLELICSGLVERLRSWHRRRLAVVSGSVAVVVLLATAALVTNGFAPEATTSLRATPVGWDSLAYGPFQVSFPPQFLMITPEPGGVFQATVPSLSASGGCLGPVSGTVVCLLPMHQAPPAYAGETVINGVPVYFGPKDDYYAPSLRVEITASGPLARQILNTLSRNRMPGCTHLQQNAICGSFTVVGG
ncbi:MAG: hypothetical protein ABSD85_15575 [Acidimicrobiales bacterium]|jgi:hypothetical protein